MPPRELPAHVVPATHLAWRPSRFRFPLTPHTWANIGPFVGVGRRLMRGKAAFPLDGASEGPAAAQHGLGVLGPVGMGRHVGNRRRTGMWNGKSCAAATSTASVVLPKRWIVELTLAWISRCRRLARDYERHARKAAVFVRLALSRLMLRRLGPSR